MEKEKLWNLGKKELYLNLFNLEYTHTNLFSHIIGQVDYDNYGISGIEKYFDKELKDQTLTNNPIKLTLDTNIQYLINEELNKALITFDATGAGSLLYGCRNW